MLRSSSPLRALGVRTIIGAVADAAERWCNADFAPRVRATRAIEERTGYTEPVIDYALDVVFKAMRAEAIADAIVAELGSLEVLDGFARSGERRRMARGLESILIISSRTTIGVALAPAIFALCAKSAVTVKDRSDDLVRAFFATLAQERPEFTDAAVAQTWRGGEGVLEAAILGAADAVVAFGSDATLEAIRARTAPESRFIGYGARVGAGYIAREALASESNVRAVARGAARDFVLYDTEGCLSLQMLFVEEGGAIDPRAFTAIFAEAVHAAAIEFPLGSQNEGVRFGIAARRDRAAFAEANGAASLFAAPNLDWLLTLDASRNWPPPLLPRCATVLPVREPADALAYLRDHRLPLEGLALAPEPARADVLAFAVESGAAQVRAPGALQRPPIGIAHGGRPRIAEFVRWIDASEEHPG